MKSTKGFVFQHTHLDFDLVYLYKSNNVDADDYSENGEIEICFAANIKYPG